MSSIGLGVVCRACRSSSPCICWGVGGTGDVQVEALFPQGQKGFELGSSGWDWCLGSLQECDFADVGGV
jgi:hypothetical protein